MERILISKTPQSKGQNVSVSGWVWGRRDHGKLIFIDVKDRTGILRCVFLPNNREPIN